MAHLFQHVDPERVHVIRYRELIDDPARTVDGIAAFLGVEHGLVSSIPASNTHGWAGESATNSLLRYAVRAGAAVGSLAPPQVWRRAQQLFVAALQRGAAPRPRLKAETRRAMVPHFVEDVGRLEALLGRSFHDWLSDSGRGAFTERQADPGMPRWREDR